MERSNAGCMLEGKKLTKIFTSGFFKRKKVVAVENVDVSIPRGETVGLIGESGSGKSTLARLLCLLIKPTSGCVLFDGSEVTNLKRKDLKTFRRKVQLIPQHPEEALDPRWKVVDSVAEPAKIHGILNRNKFDFVRELFEIVGLKKEHMDRYPYELSGGEVQRIVIARALSLKPEILICDEPTSMLDASFQASIVRLLMDLQKELKIGYLFITHDVELARAISNRFLIMFKGEIVEDGLIDEPLHPYTKQLFSFEIPETSRKLSRGCKFSEVCTEKIEICDVKKPELIDLGKKKVKCHLYSK